MNLDLNEQQEMMQDAARRFFDRDEVVQAARVAGEATDTALWRDAAEMGFVTMRAAEDKGGLGMGLMEAALICEAAGRGAAPIPIADGIAACTLLGGLEDGAATALLGEAMTRPVGFDAVVDGTQLVLDGDSLHAIATDGSRTMIASGNAVAEMFEAALNERALLRAAWLIGAGTRAVEMAAAYATERKQFNQPIGAFQGVAFPLADSFTDMEGARLLVWRTIWGIAEGQKDAGALIALADWWTATTARAAVRRSLRVFGGYGLSVEYGIHLYFLSINRVALAAGDPEGRLIDAGDRLWGGASAALPDAGEPGVEMGFTSEEESFAAEVRRFLEVNVTDDIRAKAKASTDGHIPELHVKLAAAGLAYPDWPAEWGGQGRSPMEVTALGRVFEEFGLSRIPIGCTNMGARMTMKFGSPELKAEVLPRLADGSALACLGFTEPGSGSDMYAARTRATRDGDDWIISGQKMFTTIAHISDYILMLARTDPDAPKHKGITIFFFPLRLPGITIQPVNTVQEERTNITFYDDVRVPDRYRLGEVNGGLKVMAAAMEIEHGGEGYHIYHHSLMRAAVEWARATDASGNRPIENPAVRARLAKARAHMEIADLFCRRVTWAIGADRMTRAIGPMAKMFTTDIYMEDAGDLVALTAPASLKPATPALSVIEESYRQSLGQTIYGGTSEVHRGIIAQHGLGLPRA
ncbi:alkylation response protein AidB-like acyl-CoA dehydrogenase [Sphingobium sp. OAS761]|uniref:acyl-CoA dehydrogenase n=1 Tax=Sphingobium sp. OAS761 TaxID=2817901 RepID=UPI00209EB5BA|nr:acyl-CoA dehydrogenase [Sphingobium sp. OAS761]MCP1470324.1 alkylation response protein AidB-like acyl-CoA dehydrogenase [Sphingobium sp. OAS761]